MREIIEIIPSERLKKDFEFNYDNIIEKMSKRKMLYQIENYLDLDNILEEMHSAKLSCDFAINILERTIAELNSKLKKEKDTFREEELKNAIAFENSLKKELAFTTKEMDKRTERYLLEALKEKKENILELTDDLEVCKFELNNLNRFRENIDDIYMSLKKKYDLLIKRNVT